jgi:hypothetical protein
MNAVVRRIPLLILTVAGLLSAQALHAQSVATNPVGYNMFTLSSGYNVRVNTFVQATVFQGTASSVTNASNSVITLSSSATALTSGSYNEVNGEPAYYVEILDSGSAQGLIADIVSNGTNTVTVATNLIPFGTLSTCSFLIRPHTTLSSLFPVATSGLSAYADFVVLYFPNGTNQLFNYTGTGDGWVSSSNADAGNQIIYPGQGFLLYVTNAKTVPVVGYVKPGPTQVPMYAGAVNLMGTLNPVLSGTQTLSNYNFPASLAPYADFVVAYTNTNGTLQASSAISSNGSNMFVSGNTDADSTPVSASSAVYVNVYQNENWLMPSFYTSGN